MNSRLMIPAVADPSALWTTDDDDGVDDEADEDELSVLSSIVVFCTIIF